MLTIADAEDARSQDRMRTYGITAIAGWPSLVSLVCMPSHDLMYMPYRFGADYVATLPIETAAAAASVIVKREGLCMSVGVLGQALALNKTAFPFVFLCCVFSLVPFLFLHSLISKMLYHRHTYLPACSVKDIFHLPVDLSEMCD